MLPKRDRAVLGERMLDAGMDMLSEFAMSYKLRGADKLIHTDRFIARFEVLKGLMRLSVEKKANADLKKPNIENIPVLGGGPKAKKETAQQKKYISTFEYIKRIDDGIIAWRESLVREIRSTTASNYGRGSDMQQQLRGGDGIINTNFGSAPMSSR